MAEETLAQPLSGEEIIEAVSFRLRELLQRDCFLNAAIAYEGFDADISVTIRLKDMGREPTVKAHFREHSTQLPDANDPMFEAKTQLDESPPNQVRIETEQPIPVLTTDQDGRRDIKHVKYDRPKDKPRER